MNKPQEKKPARKRFMDGAGRKLTVTRMERPQDHPQVKRFPLAHPYMKAFYLSTSAGSVLMHGPARLEDLFVVEVGGKTSAVSRAVVESYWPLPDTGADAE